MCGIGGVIEFEEGLVVSRKGLQRMARAIAHRGPDDEGLYWSREVGLVHRRLSIIDLNAGHQPMETSDRQVCLIFNGEIYNYRELGAVLESEGYVFRTKSDTEVLLAMYIRDGLDAFAQVNGMFACALWDRRLGKLVLARDRLGKKPLFFYKGAQRFLFGSEIKSLLAYGGIEREINLRALHEYLTHGYIVGDHSIIKGIQRVPPGHVLTVHNERINLESYWQLHFNPSNTVIDEQEIAEEVGNLIREAVKRRLMSDVPLGAFLSGGLDSSTVVALMTELSDRPVRTFTIGFEDTEHSEIEDARIVAKHFGTDHSEIILNPPHVDVLPTLVWHLDEPFGDSSALPTYFICRAAREHVTVALSGDGGDEVFAGYARYQDLHRYRRMRQVPAWIRQGIIRPLASLLPLTAPARNYLYAMGHITNGGLPCELGMYPYIQAELYTEDLQSQLGGYDPIEPLERILSRVVTLDEVSRYQYLDTLQYLPGDILTKVDRMSMANSLEVRSPLLDYHLVEYMAKLPVELKFRGQVGKYILRTICSGLLPPKVLTKRKQGFAIPKAKWFQNELNSYAEEILFDRTTLSRGYFREETIRRILQHHATGSRDYSTWIWCLIILEIWLRIFVDGDVLRDMQN